MSTDPNPCPTRHFRQPSFLESRAILCCVGSVTGGLVMGRAIATGGGSSVNKRLRRCGPSSRRPLSSSQLTRGRAECAPIFPGPALQGSALDNASAPPGAAQFKGLLKDQWLFAPGEVSKGLYILVKGRVRVYWLSPEGREQTLTIA